MVTRYLDAQGPRLGQAVRAAVAALTPGGIVAIPTDTVYGLAVRADDANAVRALYAVKRRPPTNPLPILLPDTEALGKACAGVPQAARALGQAFWPGPLTLVLAKSRAVSDRVTAGSDTVGVRVPDHPVALAVLQACEFMLAVTSANIASREPAATPEDVRRTFSGDIPLILAAGPCPGGVPSTVVQVTDQGLRILRAGAVQARQLEAVLRQEHRSDLQAGTL